MQTWEERIMIKQEGIAEGRIEGEKGKKIKIIIGNVNLFYFKEV